MIWNRSGNENKPDEHETLEVVFHPNGGFNKAGSFTEGGNSNEYERQGYLTLEVVCTGLAYARTWGLEQDYDNKGQLADLSAETLSGKGEIRRSQWGRFSLSFLGSNRAHTSLDVSIRKGGAKHIAIVPFKETSDLDLSWDEHFAIDVVLDGRSFAELRDELRANPDFSIVVSTKLDGMRGLYTTWSPSISDGRVLKFLGDRRDVFNQADLPEEFHSVGFGDRLPFKISVGQIASDDPDD